jgi:hypothetical protein
VVGEDHQVLEAVAHRVAARHQGGLTDPAGQGEQLQFLDGLHHGVLLIPQGDAQNLSGQSAEAGKT